MKRIIILLILLLFGLSGLPSFSKTLEGGVDFDWISKTQLQRDENIAQIQKILLQDATPVKYPKKEFKNTYIDFWKDNDNLTNYQEISQGKKEDADKKYCGFFISHNLLLAYGIQYKNNMKNIYYYDAMGHLRWIDTFSDNYPKFPYLTYQYSTNGELVAAYYYVSDYDQYVFDAKKSFKGRWYKEKLYNRKARVIMTRSNY